MHHRTADPSRLAAALAALAAPAAAQDLMFPVGEGPFSWDAFQEFADAHDFSGETITLTGAATGQDGRRLEALYAYFEEATGAEVIYTGSDSFEQDIVIAAQAGNPPDVPNFPQPGLAQDLAREGRLVDLGDDLASWVRETYAAGESWAGLATFPGPDGEDGTFGLFFGTDIKSLVWYVPENFEEAGYEIPQSLEELKALTDRIVEDGETPWCIGLGAGAGTGWPATDWVEDMLLRTAPVEVYDQWTRGEISFDDERVVTAIEEFGHFALDPDFTPQGPSGVASTDFRDAPSGLFEFPPDCYMHKQASFIPNFFPEEVEVGTDVDFFYFPAYADADLGQPLLGSGGLVSLTRDAPVTRGFIEFLKTPIAHEVMMAQGQFLTPHTGANPEAYENETQAALGEILTSATTFRFDGSDLMPGEIGTSAFWTGMIDYITGTDAETVAAEIERRWQAIR
jgi:alpha-glucoside transport system substrate-binding protein